MKIPFLFGIHCHQPAENFYHVVDWAINESYASFIETAVKNKKFRFSAHYSGWLLEYIRTHREDVFNNLKKLSDEGRIEFFTGGFYEPILSAVPQDDRIGQVQMLKDYIKNYFGQDTKGLWLTERVWDPAVIPNMVEIGIENIIVDDYHLIAAGFPKESLTGYFTTEQDGCKINLFPIDMGLRYLTPFKPTEEVVKHILDAKNRNVKLISCFDDGEKFGVWPNTYEWVYKKGWLKDFIKAIDTEKEIEFMHYDEAVKKVRPSGHVYLPITSYEEMGEWSLFADFTAKFEEVKKFLKNSSYADYQEQFLKGSVWKNFLVKYPESNRLHKRTVDLSIRGKKHKSNKEFLDLLYRSQCNDSLWHGVFGGLYLPNLRNNAWTPLIQAESLYEKLEKIKLPVIEQPCDIDRNGYDEVYARGKNFNCLFETRDFGQLTAIELKDKNFNLLNVISRKKEAYHIKLLNNIKDKSQIQANNDETASIHDMEYSITQEEADRIIYDWYNKNCFVDHFMDKFQLDTFEKCSFREFSDFTNQPADTVNVEGSKILFKRNGGIYIDNNMIKTSMEKTYTLEDNKINFNIKAKAASKVSLDYACEFNFHFADVSQITINNNEFVEHGSVKTKKFEIYDNFLNKKIAITLEKEINFIWYTIHTVSQSEMGVDLTVQGITVSFSIPFEKDLNIKGTLEIG